MPSKSPLRSGCLGEESINHCIAAHTILQGRMGEIISHLNNISPRDIGIGHAWFWSRAGLHDRRAGLRWRPPGWRWWRYWQDFGGLQSQVPVSIPSARRLEKQDGSSTRGKIFELAQLCRFKASCLITVPKCGVSISRPGMPCGILHGKFSAMQLAPSIAELSIWISM